MSRHGKMAYRSYPKDYKILPSEEDIEKAALYPQLVKDDECW